MNMLAEFARYWITNLWSASLQIAIFIFLVYAISICCKRIPMRYRYFLWLLVLVRLAFPTSMTSPLGIGQYPERFIAKGIQWVSGQPFLPPPQSPIQLESPETAGVSLANAAIFSPMASRMDDSAPLLCLIWLSGVLVMGLAIVISIFLFRRKTCTFRLITRPDLVAAVHRLKVQLNIKRTIKLLEASETDGVQFPLVHGIVRATMIIPTDMVANWTIDALAPLLLHELIHIKRRDCLVNFVQIVLQVLYFYHPMVWFANWTIRREREFACDDDVVRHYSGDSKNYVRSMLKIAETAVNQRRHQLLGIAMAENHSHLGRRIRRMINKGYRVHERAGFVHLGVIFALGLFCVAVSAQGPERLSATAELESLVQEFPEGLFKNVKATFGDFVITSDKAKFDEKARKVLFRGNDKAINNNGRMSCSSVEFDLNTQSILCQ